MILGHEEIHRRLKNGEIFRKCTWDKNYLREASYVLRIANDGLLLDGKFYDPFDRENRYQGDYIVIEPGKIAILSTKEELVMPSDLVGKIGIRLEFALLGLTGLMGIQVDPLYGHDKERERLYIRVANFGNAPIRLSPGDKVFTFELHEVAGSVPKEPKDDSWPRIKRSLKDLDDASWSYLTRVEDNVTNQGETLRNQLTSETENLRQHLQPVVMFGIFLVAVTILGVILSVVLSVSNAESVDVPKWVVTVGWIILLVTLSVASITTALMGTVMIARLWKS